MFSKHCLHTMQPVKAEGWFSTRTVCLVHGKQRLILVKAARTPCNSTKTSTQKSGIRPHCRCRHPTTQLPSIRPSCRCRHPTPATHTPGIMLDCRRKHPTNQWSSIRPYCRRRHHPCTPPMT